MEKSHNVINEKKVIAVLDARESRQFTNLRKNVWRVVNSPKQKSLN